MLPAFGLSDHRTVFIDAKFRSKSSKPKYKIVKSRDKRPSKIASVGRFLQQIPRSQIFSSDQSCEEKLRVFTKIINFGLNTIMPERPIKIYETDRPWLGCPGYIWGG